MATKDKEKKNKRTKKPIGTSKKRKDDRTKAKEDVKKVKKPSKPSKAKKPTKPKPRKVKVTGINGMQEMFCKEYIVDEKYNGYQAALRAGYSKKTAQMQSSRLLSLAKVQNRIAELRKERLDRVEIGADYVLKRLVEIDGLDILDIVEEDLSGFKPLKDWPKAWRTSISGFDLMTIASSNGDTIEAVIKKIKWPDKTKNLELLGKHTDISAFTENVRITKETYEIPEGTTPQDAANTYKDAMKDEK